MLEHGFRPFRYEPFERTLTKLGDRNTESGNTLYLKNIAFVQDRVASAPMVKLPWRSF